MPGHRAKLSAFFTVIDEIFPRQMIIDQIKAVTPGQQKKRLQSAKQRQPVKEQANQRTLLQKYECLDHNTKVQFNCQFLQTLEAAVNGQ